MHCRQRQLRDEHQGARRSIWHNCAIEGFVARWTTPGDVTFNTVRGADAPNVWPKPRKLFREIDAKKAMGQRGLNRVFEVIDLFAPNFATMTKVHPCM